MGLMEALVRLNVAADKVEKSLRDRNMHQGADHVAETIQRLMRDIAPGFADPDWAANYTEQEHREAMARLAADMNAAPVVRDVPPPASHRPTVAEENPAYRQSMIDAGRGDMLP